MTVQEKSAREYGSQGQQRSCVLALKLAEAALLAEALGEKPVILLDDVMSELDASSQDYLLNKIQGWQVFITCCDPNSISEGNNSPESFRQPPPDRLLPGTGCLREPPWQTESPPSVRPLTPWRWGMTGI